MDRNSVETKSWSMGSGNSSSSRQSGWPNNLPSCFANYNVEDMIGDPHCMPFFHFFIKCSAILRICSTRRRLAGRRFLATPNIMCSFFFSTIYYRTYTILDIAYHCQCRSKLSPVFCRNAQTSEHETESSHKCQGESQYPVPVEHQTNELVFFWSWMSGCS